MSDLIYDVSDIGWLSLSFSRQEAVREFVHSHGVDPSLTYRVEFNRDPMCQATSARVYQFHGPSAHPDCHGGIDVCRSAPYEVTL